MHAHRFAQKPLPQPNYSFRDLERPPKDLKGCTLQYVNDRDHFQSCMGEMLLLCKEAQRRRPSPNNPSGSKPLSLDYLADRIDVDDPIWGYLVRAATGELLGFITVTTFTNYRKSFRWDSTSRMAFCFDEPKDEEDRLAGVRRWDKDGSLARSMQSTVRCGDIWNEGVVWPRIAEISLLGGLGCGRILLSLVMEDLTNMKATGTSNYDFVVMQATDNSIPFYESMGFVRIGAIMKDDSLPDDLDQPTFEIVSSPTIKHTTEKNGETPQEVANAYKVDVWDVIFLNKDLYKDITPSSKLLAGTMLHVPEKIVIKPRKLPKRGQDNPDEGDLPQWYTAKENDTPRMIARMHNVNCQQLVDANKHRLKGLLSNSRLKNGTQIKVSHLDDDEDDYKPYAHWGFPDDEFEELDPSYMMAIRLKRSRSKKDSERCPVLNSLTVSVSSFEPTPLALPPSPLERITNRRMTVPSGKRNPREPKAPERPASAYIFYAKQQREKYKSKLEGRSMPEVAAFVADLWEALPQDQKERYEMAADHAKKQYQQELVTYHDKMEAFQLEHEVVPRDRDDGRRMSVSALSNAASISLYNKVVKLKPGANTEGFDYKYWYVLTFIPDLKWCHLAPLEKVGMFGPDRGKSRGRTKWMLVDEKLGKEVDISSSFCIPIKAKTMKRTLDADKEEWDVIDDGTLSRDSVVPVLRTQSRDKYGAKASFSLVSTPAKSADFSPLEATMPTGEDITLHILMTKPKVGRPRGSTNSKKRKAEVPARASPRRAARRKATSRTKQRSGDNGRAARHRDRAKRTALNQPTDSLVELIDVDELPAKRRRIREPSASPARRRGRGDKTPSVPTSRSRRSPANALTDFSNNTAVSSPRRKASKRKATALFEDVEESKTISASRKAQSPRPELHRGKSAKRTPPLTPQSSAKRSPKKLGATPSPRTERSPRRADTPSNTRSSRSSSSLTTKRRSPKKSSSNSSPRKAKSPRRGDTPATARSTRSSSLMKRCTPRRNR